MNVANLTATLGLDASGFNSNINVAINQINNIKNVAARAQSALQGMIDVGSTLSSVGRTLTVGLTIPIVGLATEIFGVTTRMDSLRRALTAVDGSAATAAAQIQRLNVIAKQPGIGMEEAIQGAVRLQSAGISAQLAERSIRAFGNAVVAAGQGKEQLAEVEQILAKIAGREILSERQVNQLSLRVYGIRELIKKAFGTADISAIQKSGLGPEQIIERLTWAAEQTPHVLGGIQNDIDNFTDHLKRAADNIGQAMAPVVHDFTEAAGPAIEGLSQKFKNLNTAQKENILWWTGVSAAIPPVIWGLGLTITSLGNILKLLTAIKASSLTMPVALGVGVPLAAAGIANYANQVMDKRDGKADVDNFDAYSRVGSILWHDAKNWAVGSGGKLPSWAESKADKDSYYGRASDAASGYDPAVMAQFKKDRDAGLSPRAELMGKKGIKPEDWFPKQTPQEEREIFRAKTQLDLERARASINSDNIEQQAQEQLKVLGPIMLRQAADLKKEADEMHISRKSTAKEWLDYYKIEEESAHLEAQMNNMQRSATKERDRAAKATRDTGYRVSELNFNTNESNAMSIGNAAPEGQTAQTTFALMARVLRQREADLIQQYNNATKDSVNANEAAVRRAQIVSEYYTIENKGAELQRSSAQEKLRNEEKVRTNYIEAQKSYRAFQFDRIRAMAEEAPEGQQAEAMLNAELPRLRDEQSTIIAEQKNFLPNTREYWENAKTYWQVEDQIHKLVKDAVKERHSIADKALQDQKREASEHREMISLETQLMEARLKNNPLISATQRQQAMIPMLIKQYRQLLIPIQGETELESLRRQIDAEKIKHDVMESAGALGREASARVLGGGRIDLFNRRMVQNIMGQLDAPMSQQEQNSYKSPQARAEQLANDFSRGRPVVVQITLPNDPQQIGREIYEALENLNKGAAPFPARR